MCLIDIVNNRIIPEYIFFYLYITTANWCLSDQANKYRLNTEPCPITDGQESQACLCK